MANKGSPHNLKHSDSKYNINVKTLYSQQLRKTVESLRVILEPETENNEQKNLIPKYLTIYSKTRSNIRSPLHSQTDRSRSPRNQTERKSTRESIKDKGQCFYLTTPRKLRKENLKLIHAEDLSQAKEKEKKVKSSNRNITQFNERLTTVETLRRRGTRIINTTASMRNLEDEVDIESDNESIHEVVDGTIQMQPFVIGVDNQDFDENNLMIKFKELNMISEYHDQYFAIENSQKNKFLNTNRYWDRLKLSKLMRKNMDFFRSNKQEKDKFTFRRMQKEFEELWLRKYEELAALDKEKGKEEKEFLKVMTSGGNVFKKSPSNEPKETDSYELKILRLRKRLAMHRRLDEIKKRENDVEYEKVRIRESKEIDKRRRLHNLNRYISENPGSTNDITEPKKTDQTNEKKTDDYYDKVERMKERGKHDVEKDKEKNNQSNYSFQECECKHTHFIGKYRPKNSHKSLVKANRSPPTERVIRTLYADLKMQTPISLGLYLNDKAKVDSSESIQDIVQNDQRKGFSERIQNFIKNGFKTKGTSSERREEFLDVSEARSDRTEMIVFTNLEDEVKRNQRLLKLRKRDFAADLNETEFSKINNSLSASNILNSPGKKLPELAGVSSYPYMNLTELREKKRRYLREKD